MTCILFLFLALLALFFLTLIVLKTQAFLFSLELVYQQQLYSFSLGLHVSGHVGCDCVKTRSMLEWFSQEQRSTKFLWLYIGWFTYLLPYENVHVLGHASDRENDAHVRQYECGREYHYDYDHYYYLNEELCERIHHQEGLLLQTRLEGTWKISEYPHFSRILHSMHISGKLVR